MHKLKNRNTFVPDTYKIPGSGDPIERNRQAVRVNIDRSCFQKDENQKWLLKKAKTKFKWDQALKELKHSEIETKDLR